MMELMEDVERILTMRAEYGATRFSLIAMRAKFLSGLCCHFVG